MTAYCFDTSALVKRYHTEPGSNWIRELFEARSDDIPPHSDFIYLAEITIAETAAAFAILTRTNRIHLQVRDRMYRRLLKDVLSDYHMIHVTRAHIDAAADLTQRHPLKGYDAVQLAVAIDVNQRLKQSVAALIFVSADGVLLQAAQSEGLTTDNPFDHTDLDHPTK
jgi:predicted nucleic acid-binding protein